MLKMLGLKNTNKNSLLTFFFKDFHGFHKFKSTLLWLVVLISLIHLFFICPTHFIGVESPQCRNE